MTSNNGDTVRGRQMGQMNDRVRSLATEGRSVPEIVEFLGRNGYTADERHLGHQIARAEVERQKAASVGLYWESFERYTGA
jgi:hypothetical protein